MGYNKGKLNPAYKDGRSYMSHFCKGKNCNNTIGYVNFLYGSQLCRYCGHKGLTLGNKNGMYGKPSIWKGKKRPNVSGTKHCFYGKKRPLHSKRMTGKRNPMYGKPSPGIKHKQYKKIKMRSSYEIAYAKYLDNLNIIWEYEAKTFDLGNTTYTPDFYIPYKDLYIEVKGYWRGNAKTKFNLFIKKYPHINIVLLEQNDLKLMGVIT